MPEPLFVCNPADPFTEIAPGVFVADAEMVRLGLSRIPIRMTVFRLTDEKDGLLVYSPFYSPEILAAVQRLGRPLHVVAPNRLHWVWAQQFVAAHPGARLYSSYVLPQRFPKRDWGTVVTPGSPTDLIGPDFDVVAIDGWPFFGEVVLCHRPSRTLAVADLVFNMMSRGCLDAVSYYVFRSMGIVNKPCTHSGPFTWFITDHAAVEKSLERVLALDFDRIIVAHGDIVPTNAKELFRKGVVEPLIARNGKSK